MNEYKEVDVFDGYYDFTVVLDDNFDAVEIYTYSDFLNDEDFEDFGYEYMGEDGKDPATELYKKNKYKVSKTNKTFSYFKNKREINWIWQNYLRQFVSNENEIFA